MEMLSPTCPIIINEHGDVSFFTSVHQAERYLEVIDVQNNEYVGYDAEGRHLSLRIVDRRVNISLSAPADDRSQELEFLLRAWLAATSDTGRPPGDLLSLVDYCVAKYR